MNINSKTDLELSEKNMLTEFANGNQALRSGDYVSSIEKYIKALIQTPELKDLISKNLSLAKKRYRKTRSQSSQKRVAVCGWELAHNPAGRVYTLAKLYETFSDVEIIGSIFPKWGREIWEPIRDTAIKKHSFVVDDESIFLQQAIELVIANPYDIVHLSKPRAPNIFFGVLYKFIWGATVLMDIDDEELAFVGEENPISIDDYIQQYGKLPDLRDLSGKDWTRIAVGLARDFDGVTVCNSVLQAKYGGEIIRHARDEKLYQPSAERKRRNREKFGIPIDKKVVLFHGTPRKHKGLIETAQAISSLNREDILFVIAGSFPHNELSLKERLLEVKGVNYFFIENQPFEEIPNVVSIADCCVILSDETSSIAKYQTPAKISDVLGMGVSCLISKELSLQNFFDCPECIPVTHDDLLKNLNQLINSTGKNFNFVNKYFLDNLSNKVISVKLKKIIESLDCGQLGSNFKDLENLLFDRRHDLFFKASPFSPHDSTTDISAINANLEYQISPRKLEIFEDEKVEWDALSYPSITTTQKLPPVQTLYIFPAVMSERNTTRYRAFHLLDICNGITDVQVLDYRSIQNDFFEKINYQKSVVVLQRIPFAGKIEEDFFNLLRATSVPVVYDIDDQIFDATELEDWRIRGLPNHPDKYKKAMKYADFFSTSTKNLRNKIEATFLKPTYVLQNCLNNDQVLLSNNALNNNFRAQNIFTIGYASGSATHDEDLYSALAGIGKFLREYKNVKFQCIGEVSLPPSFSAEFQSQIVLNKSVNWRDLPAQLAKFSVQVIPLALNKFNSYKSHIRYLESSAVKVPVLATNAGEQGQTIADGFNGRLCSNTEESWYEGLKWYFDHQSESENIAQNAYDLTNKYFAVTSPFRINKANLFLQDVVFGAMRDKISIVLVTYNPLQDIMAICQSIIAKTDVPYELLIWINNDSPEVCEYIESLPKDKTYVLNFHQNVGKAVAANHLFKIATERFIVGFDDDYVAPDFWAERMIFAAKSVPNLGWLSTNLTPDSSGLRGLGKSTSFPGGVCIYQPSGVGGWVVFTTASAREKIGFYREHGLYGGVDGDFNRRARSLGLVTGYVRNVIGQHKTQRENSLAWELFKQRIQDKMRTYGKDSNLVTDKFVDFFKDRPQQLTCSIKISTSTMHDENVWGDTHFAAGLKSALENLNYIVRVDKHEDWYMFAEQDDVVVHLFGLHEYRVDPYSLNILWIISHPEKINRKMLIKYDYIFCASEDLLNLVSSLAPEIRSELLFQCTDESVFYPIEGVVKDIDVLFIGNSRRIYRNSVKYAVQSDLNLQVWGTKWEQFIPKKYIKGQSIPSTEVANLYRRSKIILNDHWDDQIKYGLVNNRVFDGFAAGSIVVSDLNPGLRSIFGESSPPLFRSENEFNSIIDSLLNDPDSSAELLRRMSAEVLAKHTFRNRAEKISTAIKYLIESYVTYKSEDLYKLRLKEVTY